MNRKFKKQVKAYAGLAGTILVSNTVKGQMVYTDIVPDDTLSGFNAYLNYDFNGDAAPDIFLSEFSYNMGSISTDPYSFRLYFTGNLIHKNMALGCVPGAIAALGNPSDTIPSNMPGLNFGNIVQVENWIDDNVSSSNNCFFAAGNLNTDYCLGVKLLFNGQFHYGWMRIELLNKKVVIKEYAYQLQPNVAILGCDLTDLSTGIKENNSHFNFSQQNNSIHISTLKNLNHASILVYDLLGKEILKQPFSGKETTIAIDKKGIYFVEVNSDKGILRKKVFIY